MANEPNKEQESEFKTSPLYKGLKSAFGSEPLAENEGHIGDDDFSGFLKADRTIRKILRLFCWISAAALVVIMLVAFINVIGEKLGRAGVAWARGINNSTDIIKYFHIPLVFLAAGYVTLDMGHTRIDLLIQKAPKVEKVFMAIGHLLGAAISFFISYRGTFVILAENFRIHAHIGTNADSWSVWPFTVCHCLGFLLLGLSFVWAFVRMVRFWKYDGVNPGGYLYPNERHGPPGADEAMEEEGGETA